MLHNKSKGTTPLADLQVEAYSKSQGNVPWVGNVNNQHGCTYRPSISSHWGNHQLYHWGQRAPAYRHGNGFCRILGRCFFWNSLCSYGTSDDTTTGELPIKSTYTVSVGVAMFLRHQPGWHLLLARRCLLAVSLLLLEEKDYLLQATSAWHLLSLDCSTSNINLQTQLPVFVEPSGLVWFLPR